MSAIKSLFFVLFVSTTSVVMAQSVGDTIADYTFSDVINGSSFSTQQYKGKKPIIIEFWATWCRPCIPAMGHLQKIQKEFSEELEIVTVSSDNREKLMRYFETTNSALRIAYDTSHLSVFNYSTVPHTILVDGEGIIKGITTPKQLTPRIIEELIAGQDLSIDEQGWDNFTKETDTLYHLKDNRKELIVTDFRKGRTTRTKLHHSENGKISKYTIDNMGIVSIYRELSKTVSSARIVFLDSLTYDDFPYVPENLMCVEITYLSDEIDLANEEVFRFLNSVSNVKARKSELKVDYYELTRTRKVLEPSGSDSPYLTFGGPFYSSKKQPIEKLAFYLENVSQTPVIDNTGLDETYDIELNWQLEAPETVNDELAKYGLHIERVRKKKRKKIAVLEVYK